MILMSSSTKVIGKDDQGYFFDNLTSKKNIKYHGWELGKTFEGDGMDDNRHNVTFNFDNDTLREHHVRLNDPDMWPETYNYTIDDKNNLLMTIEDNGIVCRRWFKREASKA